MKTKTKLRLLSAISYFLLCLIITIVMIDSSLPVNAVDDGTCTNFPQSTGPVINNCGKTCEGTCHYSVRHSFNSCTGLDDNNCKCTMTGYVTDIYSCTCGPNSEGAWQLYDKIGAGLGKHYTVQGFGDISKAKGNYNEAITYYNEALDFFEKHENYLAALTTVTSLLEIYEIIHDMDNLNIYREKEEEFRKNLNARKTFISSDNSIDIKELISV